MHQFELPMDLELFFLGFSAKRVSCVINIGVIVEQIYIGCLLEYHVAYILENKLCVRFHVIGKSH